MRELSHDDELSRALAVTATQPHFVGLGDRSHHGIEFARKLRLGSDPNSWPLYSAPPQLYDVFGWRDAGTLRNVYASTVDMHAVRSALRALQSGHLPVYDSGGSLTRLGGTAIIEHDADMLRQSLDGDKAHSRNLTPSLHVADTKTAGHVPPRELAHTLLRINARSEKVLCDVKTSEY